MEILRSQIVDGAAKTVIGLFMCKGYEENC